MEEVSAFAAYQAASKNVTKNKSPKKKAPKKANDRSPQNVQANGKKNAQANVTITAKKVSTNSKTLGFANFQRILRKHWQFSQYSLSILNSFGISHFRIFSLSTTITSDQLSILQS